MAGYFSTCNECGAHGTTVHYLTKRGGGNYRRPARNYDASVCRFCVDEMASYISTRESDYNRYGALIWMYRVDSVRHEAAKIAERRATVGDFAFGVSEAEMYWGDHKRMVPLMANRIAAETDDYHSGFDSVAH